MPRLGAPRDFGLRPAMTLASTVALVKRVPAGSGVSYLHRHVTEREATRASELTRTVSGVQKVVRVFEIISEEELADMSPRR